MARMRTAVVAAALVATMVPVTLGGSPAFAGPSPAAGATAAHGSAAAAGAAAGVGTVVQNGGRLTIVAGEEGAVTLRFTASLPAGTQGPVSAVLHLTDHLVARAGASPVSEDVIRSTCAVNGVAYGACAWDMPFVRAGESVDPPSLALPTVPAAAILAYTVTLDADRSATILGRPDARVELKDGTGAVVAAGTVGLHFVPGTPPASMRGAVHARDKSGVLWRYEGTGDVRRPFAVRKRVGGGWNAYTTVTPLRSTTAAGEGDLVARDRNGVLWYYRGTGDPDAPFAPRERVGGGWNVYTALNGDGFSGVVARDRDGVLWHYDTQHNGYGWPFGPRERVGGGWNVYGTLTISGQWDGILARDKQGVLWKYPHENDGGSRVFKPRERVGGGWNIYTAVAGTDDLGRDGEADLVARDTAGRLWSYQGVRKQVPYDGDGELVPGATRTLVGGGWNTYDLLF
ncbi:hypothetical protein ACFV14_00745 [Streptomyces zaomyceticus]|uniref:hypothetical protein n=1 Tax=Streptomyces zaomyceticus TaxID=68286 RepID=UPI00367F6C9D